MDKLKPEQEAVVPVYRDKWNQTALSTRPIDRDLAMSAVEATYIVIGEKKPKILFFDSPYSALGTAILLEQQQKLLELKIIGMNLMEELAIQLGKQLGRQLFDKFKSYRKIERLDIHLIQHLKNFTSGRREEVLLYNCLKPEERCEAFTIIDFCISVLNYSVDQKQWQAFQLLVESCGWIFSFEETCLVCDRPIKLFFDNENNLHAEGKPAIQFADGFSIYVYHGERLEIGEIAG